MSRVQDRPRLLLLTEGLAGVVGQGECCWVEQFRDCAQQVARELVSELASGRATRGRLLALVDDPRGPFGADTWQSLAIRVEDLAGRVPAVREAGLAGLEYEFTAVSRAFHAAVAGEVPGYGWFRRPATGARPPHHHAFAQAGTPGTAETALKAAPRLGKSQRFGPERRGTWVLEYEHAALQRSGGGEQWAAAAKLRARVLTGWLSELGFVRRDRDVPEAGKAAVLEELAAAGGGVQAVRWLLIHGVPAAQARSWWEARQQGRLGLPAEADLVQARRAWQRPPLSPEQKWDRIREYVAVRGGNAQSVTGRWLRERGLTWWELEDWYREPGVVPLPERSAVAPVFDESVPPVFDGPSCSADMPGDVAVGRETSVLSGTGGLGGSSSGGLRSPSEDFWYPEFSQEDGRLQPEVMAVRSSFLDGSALEGSGVEDPDPGRGERSTDGPGCFDPESIRKIVDTYQKLPKENRAELLERYHLCHRQVARWMKLIATGRTPRRYVLRPKNLQRLGFARRAAWVLEYEYAALQRSGGGEQWIADAKQNVNTVISWMRELGFVRRDRDVPAAGKVAVLEELAAAGGGVQAVRWLLIHGVPAAQARSWWEARQQGRLGLPAEADLVQARRAWQRPPLSPEQKWNRIREYVAVRRGNAQKVTGRWLRERGLTWWELEDWYREPGVVPLPERSAVAPVFDESVPPVFDGPSCSADMPGDVAVGRETSVLSGTGGLGGSPSGGLRSPSEDFWYPELSQEDGRVRPMAPGTKALAEHGTSSKHGTALKAAPRLGKSQWFGPERRGTWVLEYEHAALQRSGGGEQWAAAAKLKVNTIVKWLGELGFVRRDRDVPEAGKAAVLEELAAAGGGVQAARWLLIHGVPAAQARSWWEARQQGRLGLPVEADLVQARRAWQRPPLSPEQKWDRIREYVAVRRGNAQSVTGRWLRERGLTWWELEDWYREPGVVPLPERSAVASVFDESVPPVFDGPSCSADMPGDVAVGRETSVLSGTGGLGGSPSGGLRSPSEDFWYPEFYQEDGRLQPEVMAVRSSFLDGSAPEESRAALPERCHLSQTPMARGTKALTEHGASSKAAPRLGMSQRFGPERRAARVLEYEHAILQRSGGGEQWAAAAKLKIKVLNCWLGELGFVRRGRDVPAAGKVAVLEELAAAGGGMQAARWLLIHGVTAAQARSWWEARQQGRLGLPAEADLVQARRAWQRPPLSPEQKWDRIREYVAVRKGNAQKVTGRWLRERGLTWWELEDWYREPGVVPLPERSAVAPVFDESVPPVFDGPSCSADMPGDVAAGRETSVLSGTGGQVGSA